MRPAVSIVTPLYNGANFIGQTIRSVQAQSLSDHEHIIIDNMSTDGGADIARQAAQKDSRISVLQHSQSQGASGARNAGITAAQGRYIAFLDCDDLWKPEKTRLQVAAMAQVGAAFSWTAYDIVDETGRDIRTQMVPIAGTMRDLLNRKLVIGCLTAMYDSALLGKRLMTSPVAPEDFCLWADILTTCEARALPTVGLSQALAVYRVHVAGVSANKQRAALAYWRACRSHLGLSRLRSAGHFAQYVGRSLVARL